MAMVHTRAELEADMREILGLVPSFFSQIPDGLLEHEWALFKQMELGETLIPNKYKELMGIAIDSETKCRYCTLCSTQRRRRCSGQPRRRYRSPFTTPR